MALTPSTMVPLGSPMTEFRLPDYDGKDVDAKDFARSEVLVVIFMCNHCPFVKHIAPGLASFARDYAEKSLSVVAINSNDIESHPGDRPEKMREEAITQGYSFPYLFDDTQAVARDFKAACTPDFFVYDRDRRLAYRGQFDASRPGNDVPVTGADLRAAVDELLAGRPVSAEQTPSIGCNIKWKAGNEPGGSGRA